MKRERVKEIIESHKEEEISASERAVNDVMGARVTKEILEDKEKAKRFKKHYIKVLMSHLGITKKAAVVMVDDMIKEFKGGGI